MNSKLADWDDDDPQTIQDTSSRWDKVVILKHMFTLQELEVRTTHQQRLYHFQIIPCLHPMCVQEDPAAILDIKEDIREECSKMGPVTNVVLFDKETDGVASVRYSNAEAADACIKVCTMFSVLFKIASAIYAFSKPPLFCSSCVLFRLRKPSLRSVHAKQSRSSSQI